MGQQATACEKCGLRAVKRELERDGVIIRFCDECYWGEVEGEATPADHSKGQRPAPAEPAR